MRSWPSDDEPFASSLWIPYHIIPGLIRDPNPSSFAINTPAAVWTLSPHKPPIP